MEESTQKAVGAQEAPKPLTLNSIEALLLEKELNRLASKLWSAAKAYRAAIAEASGNGRTLNTKPIMTAIMERLDGTWSSFEGWNLKEVLTDDSKKEILERVSKGFLARVEEIGQIAEDAAARVEED